MEDIKPLVTIDQRLAILVDGNNIEKSIHQVAGNDSTMLNFNVLIPRIVGPRSLTRFVYFREGRSISPKLADRLHRLFYGVVMPCNKTADIPLAIEAVQLVGKIDTIIILSGDSDYLDLINFLKPQGVRVEIAALKISTSATLKDSADYYHEIVESDFFKYNPAYEKTT